MMGRRVAGQVYTYAVIVLGAVIVTSAVSELELSRPGLFAALLVLSIASSALRVDVPSGVGSSSISLSYAVDFTALILLGPAPTMLIALTGGWSQCTLRTHDANRVSDLLFTAAAIALSVAAAGLTYTTLGGTYGTLQAPPLQPLMAAAMVYFFVNSFAAAAACALSGHRGVMRVWLDHFLWAIGGYVLSTIAAGVAVEAFNSGGQWQTALAFVPLGLTYRTYRLHLKRMADEQKRIAEWAQSHRDSTEVLARAMQSKDEIGSRHVERVQYYAATLARSLDLPDLDRQAVEIAALLHDIGKLAIPEHILSKPGPLTPDERVQMQLHAQIGAEIVSAVPFPCPVAPLIRCHHERWDGKGYPSGLRGEQIPVGARVLSVADFYDALTSRRPYRDALSQEVTLAMLHAEAGKAFDPAIVARFTELLPMLKPPSQARDNAFPEMAAGSNANNATRAITRVATDRRTLAETMTLVSTKLSTQIPFSSCVLFVRGADNNLHCRFAIGAHADVLDKVSIADGDGLSGWVARHRRPLVNGLPIAEFNAAGVQVSDLQVRSALICPLTLGEEVIGTIALFHDAADGYTDNHRRMLDHVAGQAASVVHDALLFEGAGRKAVLKHGPAASRRPRALPFEVPRESGRRKAAPLALVLGDADESPRRRERIPRRR